MALYQQERKFINTYKLGLQMNTALARRKCLPFIDISKQKYKISV